MDISGVDIGAMEIDRSSEGYQQLMAVTKDLTVAKTRAETADYIERLRIQREEGQYAQHKATQSTNFAAFQTEKQAEVGIAGANALGQMGANGAGNVNLGEGGGTGFNPAAMMAGMAVGGAVGQNMAGMMSGMMSGMNQQPASGTVPPPIPAATYHVAVNGQATGPYDLTALKQMADAGQLTSDSLVWQSGMVTWEKAGTIDRLRSLFNMAPPIP